MRTIFPATLTLFVLACGAAESDDADTGGDTQAASSSSGADTTGNGMSTTAPVTTNDDSGSGSSDEGAGIITPPDNGPSVAQCDVWMQDCPRGEKCMPWSNDGGNAWNDAKCVPVTGDGQPGDPCTVQGEAVSGIDDCDAGLMCYNVQFDTLMGSCYPLCGGTPASPACDSADDVCAVYNDGFLPLCLAYCDPIQQDCPGGTDLCLPSPVGDSFVCVLDALPGSDGGWATSCSFSNACDAGLFCADGATVPGCVSGSCCSEFCDVTQPDPDTQCTGAAQGAECLSWWNGNPPPPGYDHVGFCGLP